MDEFTQILKDEYVKSVKDELNYCHKRIKELTAERDALTTKLYEIERAEPAEPLTEDQKYALIKKHLGLNRRRDDAVIDNRTGRWTDAARYFALIDEVFAHDTGATPGQAKREPLTQAQVDACWDSNPGQGGKSRYDITRDIEQACAQKWGILLDDAVVEKPAKNTPETAQPVDFADVLRGGQVGGKCCRTCGPDGCKAIDGAPVDSWVIIGPDGSRFIGQSPHRAANAANKHFGAMQQAKNPNAAAEFAALLEETRREAEQQDDNLMALYGSLNCPTCGGSGHVGDAISNCKSSTEGGKA